MVAMARASSRTSTAASISVASIRTRTSTADSSSSNAYDDAESTPGGMRIVFRESERGISSLCRGWRTPDPSPTRGAGKGLPRCAATKCEVDFFPVGSDSDEDPKPALEARSFRQSASTVIPPPPQADLSWVRERTPSPDTQRYDYWAAEHNGMAMAWPESSETWPECSEMMAMPVQPVLCVMACNQACDQAWPSYGSFGHPYYCNEACKYVKKNKGCKDGVNCDHCHLCEWKKVKRPQNA